MAKGKNHPVYETPAELEAKRQAEAPSKGEAFAAMTEEMTATLEAAKAVAEAPARPGTYYVCLVDHCPRRIVETGLPAGPAAEAVARERYMSHYELVQRPGRVPEVELLE